MKSLDLAVISGSPAFCQRTRKCAEFFSFTYEIYSNDEDFFVGSNTYKNMACVLLDCSQITKPNEVAGVVQVARQGAPESYILVVASSKLSPEDARIVKASGASIVTMDSEFYSSSKIEFILTQVIRSAFIPIKAIDLMPDSEPTFSLYYLMPLNNKFLKLSKPGIVLNKEFLAKCHEMGELYISRNDLDAWAEYTNMFSADDSESHARRCRLKFLQLNQSFLNLALLITDQSSGASFAQGKELYDVCAGFASDLLKSLQDIQDPWIVVNNSAIGDFGSVERAPSVAAYAGLLSLETKIGNPLEIMIGALLSDIGYLDLSPSATEKVRCNKINEMNGEESMEYHKHPIFSLNQCLSRKLPLSEVIKDIILQSHERVDQKGFPHRPRADKLSEEAMLVQLCWDLDAQSQVRMGEQKKMINDIKKQVVQAAQAETSRYSLGFLMKLAKNLNVTTINLDATFSK